MTETPPHADCYSWMEEQRYSDGFDLIEFIIPVGFEAWGYIDSRRTFIARAFFFALDLTKRSLSFWSTVNLNCLVFGKLPLESRSEGLEHVEKKICSINQKAR